MGNSMLFAKWQHLHVHTEDCNNCRHEQTLTSQICSQYTVKDWTSVDTHYATHTQNTKWKISYISFLQFSSIGVLFLLNFVDYSLTNFVTNCDIVMKKLHLGFFFMSSVINYVISQLVQGLTASQDLLAFQQLVTHHTSSLDNLMSKSCCKTNRLHQGADGLQKKKKSYRAT